MADKPAKSVQFVRDKLKKFLTKESQNVHLMVDLSKLGVQFGNALIDGLPGIKNIQKAIEDNAVVISSFHKSVNWEEFILGSPFHPNSDSEIKSFFNLLSKGQLPVSIPKGNDLFSEDVFQKIIQFCRDDEYSIFHPRIAEIICWLRKSNNDFSRKKLDQIFKAYKSPNSENTWPKLWDDFSKWWFEYYPEWKQLFVNICSEKSIEFQPGNWKISRVGKLADEKLAEHHSISKGTVSKSIKILKEIESILIELRSNLRKNIASNYFQDDWFFPLFYKYTHQPQELEESLFNIFAFCREIVLYKLIRRRLTTREYLPGSFSLLLSNIWKESGIKIQPDPLDFDFDLRDIFYANKEFTGEPLQKILMEISGTLSVDIGALKAIYKTNRIIEAKLNDEFDLHWVDSISKLDDGQYQSIMEAWKKLKELPNITDYPSAHTWAEESILRRDGFM